MFLDCSLVTDSELEISVTNTFSIPNTPQHNHAVLSVGGVNRRLRRHSPLIPLCKLPHASIYTWLLNTVKSLPPSSLVQTLPLLHLWKAAVKMAPVILTSWYSHLVDLLVKNRVQQKQWGVSFELRVWNYEIGCSLTSSWVTYSGGSQLPWGSPACREACVSELRSGPSETCHRPRMSLEVERSFFSWTLSWQQLWLASVASWKTLSESYLAKPPWLLTHRSCEDICVCCFHWVSFGVICCQRQISSNTALGSSCLACFNWNFSFSEALLFLQSPV